MSDKKAEFGIQYIYVKDSSFEAPVSMHRMSSSWSPEPTINFDHSYKALENDQYEVIVAVTVEVKNDKKTVFVAEIKQAGEFVVKNFSDDQKEHLLEAYCPNTLLPYARQKISDMISQGGFPPLFINPVDFEARLQHKKSKQSS